MAIFLADMPPPAPSTTQTARPNFVVGERRTLLPFFSVKKVSCRDTLRILLWWSRRRASSHPRLFGFNYDPGARKEARGATQRQKRQAGIARYQGGERPREAREARRPGLTATSPTFFTDVGGSLLTQRRTDGASLGGRHAIGPSREALGRPVDCAWQSTANEAHEPIT